MPPKRKCAILFVRGKYAIDKQLEQDESVSKLSKEQGGGFIENY